MPWRISECFWRGIRVVCDYGYSVYCVWHCFWCSTSLSSPSLRCAHRPSLRPCMLVYWLLIDFSIALVLLWKPIFACLKVRFIAPPIAGHGCFLHAMGGLGGTRNVSGVVFGRSAIMGILLYLRYYFCEWLPFPSTLRTL